jgi:transcriptional regulator GlxA family with amidase domain
MASTPTGSARRTGRTMVFVLYDKVTLQDVAAPLEIFARANDFGANYTVLLVSPTGAPVGTTAFTRLCADRAVVDAPKLIDTLIVPGGVPPDFTFTPGVHDIPEELTPEAGPDAVEAVRTLAPRASRIASVCTGAFLLAALGILNGRRATTHWAHCDRLARSYPQVTVEPDALFVHDGHIITGAGISAGTDLALAIVENDYGTDMARRVARWMVVFLQRPGGQAQFSVWSQTGSPTTHGLRDILDAVVLNPAAEHSITTMAARAAVSERHLTRIFHDEVGMTPSQYVERARLEAAKLLLVTTAESQDSIARRAGFGSAETMRRNFRRNLGVSPGEYRARFRTTGINR